MNQPESGTHEFWHHRNLASAAMTILTATAVAAGTGDAGTSHFQHPADQPGAVASATAVSQRAGTGLLPFSPDIAPGQPLSFDNPASLPAVEPVAQAAPGDFPKGFPVAASFRLVSMTVEDILEHGLRLADASPAHIAFRGTPEPGSVRCDWRGIARTVSQRDDAVRYWLDLGPDEMLPHPAVVEALLVSVLDAIEPPYIETAKSNFRSIARGGLAREYLFLTCFADYSVSAYLLGNGPSRITVAYDRMDEAASY